MALRIPISAILGLSLTGCGDDSSTIVGDWRLVALDDYRIPDDSIAGYNWPLHIKDDLSGEFLRYEVYEGEQSLYRYVLRIDDDDAPRHRIDILYESGELLFTLDCTLDGDTLDCDVDGFGYTWERDA